MLVFMMNTLTHLQIPFTRRTEKIDMIFTHLEELREKWFIKSGIMYLIENLFLGSGLLALVAPGTK